MIKQEPKIKVALKYCGCCNPYIDLSRVTRHLAKLAEEHRDFELVPLSGNDVSVVVILCGCPRACGDKEEIRARARWSLVIAGESIGGKPVLEQGLLGAVEQELGKILSEA